MLEEARVDPGGPGALCADPDEVRASHPLRTLPIEPLDSGRAVEILLVSGIWPPDIGGPASHGPEFGRFLTDRGHRVRAVTNADGPGGDDPGFEVIRARRDRPRPVRIPGAALSVLSAAPRADVVYGIGMYT